MLRPPHQQITIPQTIVQEYLKNGKRSFDAFLDAWKKQNGSYLHTLSSPRPLIYGPVQTAFATFLGFCSPSNQDITREAGVFGLYITFMTQSPANIPIFVTPDQFKWITEIAEDSQEVSSITTYLLDNNGFCFSAKDIAISTPFPHVTSPVVVDRQVFNDKLVKNYKRNEEAEVSIIDKKELNDLRDLYSSAIINLIH